MLAQIAQWFRLPMAFLACAATNSVFATDTATPSAAAANLPDLKVVEVRLVDEGNAASNLGPSYRVTVRNAGTAAATGFEVAIVAGIDFESLEEMTSAETRVESLEAGSTHSVDLRLPVEAFCLRTNAQGAKVAYRLLLVAVDPGNKTGEQVVENNRTAFDRDEIRLVGETAVPFAASRSGS